MTPEQIVGATSKLDPWVGIVLGIMFFVVSGIIWAYRAERTERVNAQKREIETLSRALVILESVEQGMRKLDATREQTLQHRMKVDQILTHIHDGHQKLIQVIDELKSAIPKT